MSVFGYVRVSTIQQVKEGDSLESQVKQVLSYSLSRGLELNENDVFIEKGVSGGSEFNARPEGFRLLNVLKAGDVLIFPKLDRGFINTRDALNTLHLLKEKGVTVHSIDLGGDVTGNGVGAIIFTILSAFASFERERIASRISDVKQMRKSQGYFVGGRRGFGFNVVDGKKVLNKNEQKLIQKMKNKKDKGESLLSIHRWLNNTVGIKLSYSSMRAILIQKNIFN